MVVILNKKLGLVPDYFPHWEELDKELVTGETDVNIDTLYEVVKKSPEVVASLNALVEDIMSDGYKFEGAKKPIEDTNKFVERSSFYKKLSNALFDFLLTGNGYQLKLSVEENRIKELLNRISQKEVIKKFGFKQKDVTKKIFFELKQKGTFKPKDLQVLKSSTIKIDYDKNGRINNYIQRVGSNKNIYKPNEIIHLSAINLGGSIYGFTALEPLLSDIGTLIFAKEYAGKFFENDGVPNMMINLPEAMGESDRNYQLLKQQITELKKKENKWRALITTGNTQITQIDKFTKDMQFIELVNHFTKIVLMAIGVPPQRINPSDIKGAPNELRTYEGYFKKINFLQRIIEDILNKNLFSEFNVKLRFNRSYKIDELREANIVAILADRGLISVEEAREMMGMEKEMKGKPINQRGQDQDIRALEGQDTRKPEEEELSEPKNRMDKPDNKIAGKTITKLHKKYDNPQEVNWIDFRNLVERIMPFQDANVLYREDEDSIVLYFHDGKWAYKTKLDKSKIDNDFKFYYLRNAVRLLL